MCISFNKVSPLQLIYHEVKAIDVTHPTDMNFYLSNSAVVKCQDNVKFKVTNYNIISLKIYIQFIEVTASSVCTTKLGAPMLL